MPHQGETTGIDIILDDNQIQKRPLQMLSMKLRVIQSSINKMKCMIISDPNASISSVSFCLNRGSSNEKHEIPGLAHFIEHMLFIGSKKYPGSNDYNDFITKNGGSSNAHTNAYETNYFHCIPTENFEESIRMLMSNITEPLFLKDYLMKEVEAVDSEYKGSLNSKYCKRRNITSKFFQPNNDILKFNIGTKETLCFSDDPQKILDEVLDFYNKNYFLENFSACFYSNLELEKIQEIFIKCCNMEENKDSNLMVPRVFGELPERTSKKQIIVKIKSPKHFDTLEYAYFYNFDSHCKGYLAARIINDMKKGSLYDLLYSNCFITEIFSEAFEYTPKIGQLFIVLNLTDKGFENYELVCSIVDDYMQFLKNSEIPNYLIDDLKLSKKMSFLLEEYCSPNDICSSIATNIHKVENPQYYLMPDQIEDFSLENEIEFIKDINFSQNGLVSLTSLKFKDEELTELEKYYSTPYGCEDLNILPIPDEFKNKFSLPTKNSYLKDCDVSKPFKDGKISDYKVSLIRCSDSNLNSYSVIENRHKKNMQFISLTITNFNLPRTIETKNTLEILSDYLQNTFDMLFYDAIKAKISFKVQKYNFGFVIKINAISDLVPKFFADLLNEFLTIKLDKQKLALYIEEHKKVIKNYRSTNPYKLGHSEIHRTYNAFFDFTIEEKLASLKNLTNIDFEAFFRNFLGKGLEMKALLFGNSEKAHQQYHDIIMKSLKNHNLQLDQSNMPEHMEKLDFKPSKSSEFIFEEKNLTIENDSPDNKENSLEVAFAVRDVSPFTKACMAIFSRIFGDMFFNEKRTEMQLGYIVMCFNQNSLENSTINFIIQGEKSPDLFKTEIMKFVDEACQKLKLLTDEEFNCAKKSEKEIYLHDSHSPFDDFKHIHEIFFENNLSIDQTNYEKISKMIEQFETIKKDECIKFLIECLQGKQRYVIFSQVNRKP